MGVYRLSQYLRENERDVVSTIDLVQLAKACSKTLKIIVHFHCWETYVRKCFLESLTTANNNNLIPLYGGEYQLLDTYTKQLLKNLREVNIELVFYLSAARGSALSGWLPENGLKPIWVDKFLRNQKNLAESMAFLRGEGDYSLKENEIGRPVLQEVQNVITLQEAGCEFHMCLTGETESVIARRLHEDNTAIGVFSDNSDFCIFPNCLWLSTDFFDRDGDLGLARSRMPEHGPEKLLCGVMRSDFLCKVLRIPNHAMLIEWSILVGNRFTGRFLGTGRGAVTRGVPLYKAARLVRTCKTVEAVEKFGRVLASEKQFQVAVHRSRLLYNMHSEDDRHVLSEGDTFPLLTQAAEEGRLPTTLLAMYHGTYWHRTTLEDPSLSPTSGDAVLSDLRAYLYSLVLPPDRDVVKEMGRGHSGHLETIQVPKVTGIPIPSLSQVKANSFQSNRRLFELIIQHQEDEFLDEQKSYFTVYGDRLGFLCYLLRYFLILNWEKNLSIEPEEFFVLFAWILTDHSVEKCLTLRIVPTPRCVTTQNWFLSLYRNAYAFLGNLLHLNQKFPAPKDLFSGSLWVVLYTAVTAKDMPRHLQERLEERVPSFVLSKYRDVVRTVIDENKEMVESIVRGLFDVELNLKKL